MTDTFLFGTALIALAIPLYAYIGYPLLVDLISRIWPRRFHPSVPSSDHAQLSVTVLIPVHNEQQWVARKVENALALDYPAALLQVLVASDGSTDETVAVARRFAPSRVEVVDYPERTGKLATLNRAVPLARGDVLVFTDAKALLAPDALQHVVSHFADPRVGGVVGNRVCVATGSPATAGEGLYWRYESWIRSSESRLGSCVGACGQIYSVRRSLFTFVAGFSDDTVIPLSVASSGAGVIAFEPRAIAQIPAAATFQQEWQRKVRSHLALFYDIVHLKKAVIPGASGIWWQFWSHHLSRFLVPWALVVAFLLSAFLGKAGSPYGWIFYAQCAFYFAAIVGYLLARRGVRLKIFYVPFYFVMANAAVGFAWIAWFQGKKQYSWKQVDRILPVPESAERAETRSQSSNAPKVACGPFGADGVRD